MQGSHQGRSLPDEGLEHFSGGWSAVDVCNEWVHHRFERVADLSINGIPLDCRLGRSCAQAHSVKRQARSSMLNEFGMLSQDADTPRVSPEHQLLRRRYFQINEIAHISQWHF